MVAGLFRWSTALWPYSGYRSPPMHGDFEAQRHWMEVTTHLPMNQWYFHDLDWWGLDYPPLTAYHSWLLGMIGSLLEPAWFGLYTSRGLDEPLLKVYMRATVLVSEYAVYVPAAVLFVRRSVRTQGMSIFEGNAALAALLMQPALILIDHGHFQYNAVMLGFVLACLTAIHAQRYLWACVFFVSALGFKQMALYYAPAVFVALLVSTWQPQRRPALLVAIAVTTVLSFAILFGPFVVAAIHLGPAVGADSQPYTTSLPFIAADSPLALIATDRSAWYFPIVQQLGQALHRIFPFARGIFEDKVANIWCVINVVVKLRQYPLAVLQRASLLATLAAVVPPCLLVLVRPSHDMILHSLTASAWAFFLFSFQVHEKSVLLPLLPMTLALARRGGLLSSARAWIGWANLLGAWTMYPLLKRDQLSIPYFVLTLLWAYLLALPPTSLSAYRHDQRTATAGVGWPATILHLTFYGLMIIWHAVEAFLPPPEGKPDLWVLANAALGAAGFGICYLWSVWQCLKLSGFLPSSMSRGVGKDSVRAKVQ